MKLIGYLFVFAVVIFFTGYLRGWFTVEASMTSGEAKVRVGVDTERAAGDAHTALDSVGIDDPASEHSTPAAQPVEARITAVDKTRRDLTVEIAGQTSLHHVADDAEILRDNQPLTFDDLLPEMRARFTLELTPPTSIVTRIVVLP
ncbi:MAG: hypothetical protein R3F29_15210 [Planctomycetota bacterium]